MSQVTLFSREGKKIQELNQVSSGTLYQYEYLYIRFYLIRIKDKNGA
ncbi:MAG: hypothetical protein QM530_07355 [Phycisphaerales bacterium]|nr:hypothetical protein [Phycisphaerales bacterium]